MCYVQDAIKRLFNKRLSGVRTVMTENFFGRLKNRFPAVRNLRQNVVQSQRIILATRILMNFCEDIMEEDPEDDGDHDIGVDPDLREGVPDYGHDPVDDNEDVVVTI